ncbi:MAG: VWA domain-containing protein [Firmicutes bacterium]|nr:VWA domain-containing protein [Bacillota bacterium]
MRRPAAYLIICLALLLFLGAGLPGTDPVGAVSEEGTGDSEAEAPEAEEGAENRVTDEDFAEDTGGAAVEPGENPDGLEEPLVIPAPALFYPAVTPKRSSLASVPGGAPGTGEFNNMEPWPDPGSLNLAKEAEAVEGTLNRWEVTLTLEGMDKEVQTSADIVLVIDRSGSMRGSRMAAAIAAAKDFVNTLLKEGDSHTRIAVVSYAGDVTVHNQPDPFKDYSGKGALLSAISGLVAEGGTFTQAGLKQAEALLENSTADFKNIVLLSDGEPTYSYAIKDVRNRLTPDYFVEVGRRTWHSRDDLDRSVFDYGKTAGNGTSSTTEAGRTGIFLVTRYYYHHGNSAVAESRLIKDAGIAIYAVGFELGATGQQIMDRIAGEGRSYAATTANLAQIFQDIAGSIAHIAAARSAAVTDPVGEMFSIPGIDAANFQSKITVSHGTIAYDVPTGTITWTLPFVEEGSPVTMSYIVEIDAGAASGALYPTNKETFVEYTNVNGEPARKRFPIPRVGIEAAGVITITKAVQPGGSTGKRFPIYVEGEGRTWAVLLAHGERASIAGLAPGTYTIREVVPMDYRLEGISPVTVILTAGNLAEEVEVTVINKKVNDSWFRDDDTVTNTFKIGSRQFPSFQPGG